MVCLGNICRSPLAEGIMRFKIQKRKIDAFVDSAGTSDEHEGEHPDSRSIQNAKNNGIDISKLRARQFCIKDFDEFDFIYVMDSSNYDDIISLTKNDHDKKKVHKILNMAFPGANRSVPDPYYGGEQGFENVFILLEKACDAIADSLEKNQR